MNDDELTVAEAAQILGVSEDTVRRRIDDGSLKGWRTKPGGGGWRRVSRASVESYRRTMRGEADRPST